VILQPPFEIYLRNVSVKVRNLGKVKVLEEVSLELAVSSAAAFATAGDAA